MVVFKYVQYLVLRADNVVQQFTDPSPGSSISHEHLFADTVLEGNSQSIIVVFIFAWGRFLAVENGAQSFCLHFCTGCDVTRA